MEGSPISEVTILIVIVTIYIANDTLKCASPSIKYSQNILVIFIYRDVSFQTLVCFQTFTPLKITFEMSALEHVSSDFDIDSDFQKTSFYYFKLFH